jgi:hypothetical protein
MVEHAAQVEKKRKHVLLVGKPKEYKALERQRYIWVENIKMEFIRIKSDGVQWVDLDKGSGVFFKHSYGSLRFQEFIERLHSWRSYT